MRIAALLAFSIFLVPSLCLSRSAGEAPPLFQVSRPTVIAFFVPGKETDLKTVADLNEALSDFQLYAAEVRQPLQQLGIDFHEVYAHSFRICVQGKTSTFHVGNKAGYYFLIPGKKPLVQFGVETDDDIVATARKYFGIAAAGH